jgi:hypothetical protein
MKDKLTELLIDGHKQYLYYDQIADYLLANGVIVPPCKVGDTVYVLTIDSPTGIEKSRVKRMSLQELQDGTTIRIIVPCVFDDWGNAIWEFYPEDFGKKVFLTKAEAERALAERRMKND